ncbi:MAG: hypothetical protein LUE94_08390 [Clostridiales bacterium]|nr:hypothetical protein [Clostridiales bacterium]
MEGIFGGINQMAPYAILKHLNQKYDALGNNLLMRLVWQSFMFLHNPFFSIAENRQYFDHSLDYLPNILRICQNRDWKALRAAVEQPVENLSTAISRFYRDRITMPAPEAEMAFAWSSYKKASRCATPLPWNCLSQSAGEYILPEAFSLPRRSLPIKRGFR